MKRFLPIRSIAVGVAVFGALLVIGAIACTGSAVNEKEALVLTPKAQLASEDARVAYAPNVPAPINRKEQKRMVVKLETSEVVKEIAPGVLYETWTFGGSVPGPVIRVREGDLIEFHLKNSAESRHPHNIDFHFATGPGGGAKATLVVPGEEAVIEVRALAPGLYMYHCAAPDIPTHIANGMYGFVLVEPSEGLPAVDHEYYVVQSEFYAKKTENGTATLDIEALDAEHPTHVVFNGSVGSLTDQNALNANVGETVRVWFGNAGPQLTASFHIIGETFDRVIMGGRVAPAFDPQVVGVPASGGVAVDFKVDVPGTYILVDHAIARAIHKGAVGLIIAEGAENPEVFEVKGKTQVNESYRHEHDGIEDDMHGSTLPDTGSSSGTMVTILSGAFTYDEIEGNDYSPFEMTIEAGTKVTWINEDDMPHTATASDNSFDSGFLAKGQSWSYVFEKPGVYEYYCMPHPWMKGRVIVK